MKEGAGVLVQVVCALVAVDLAAAVIKLNVFYPEREEENYSAVRLTCTEGGLTVTNAEFLKDGDLITSTSNLVTVTNIGSGEISFTFTQQQEGTFSCRRGSGGDESEKIGLAASPAVNYDGVERLRNITFPTPESSRDINLSCPIGPGALSERYRVKWVSRTPGVDGFIFLQNKYNITVSHASSARDQYECQVTITHRIGQGVNEITRRYDGPMIVIKNYVLATVENDVQNVSIIEVSTSTISSTPPIAPIPDPTTTSTVGLAAGVTVPHDPTSASRTGLAAGVGSSVGVILVVIFIVVLIVVFCCCIQRKKRGDPKEKETHCSTWKPNMDTETFVRPSTPIQSVVVSQQLQLQHELRDKKMLFLKNEIKLSNVIGQGESGLVYRGYYDGRMGKELVAVKTCKALSSTSDKEKLLKEVTTMLSFKHPNVMSLIGLCFDGEMPLLIMPFMSNGNVLEYVKNALHLSREAKKRHLSREAPKKEVEAARKVCLSMCHQISKGMQYLAEKKFVHRDLAARNCMIDQHGVIKVADFGLTEDAYGTNYYRRGMSEAGIEEKVPVKWMAPESIENGIYRESTDVWAFGVTCWEIFTFGRVPYAGIPTMTLLRELCTGHRLDRPSNAACSDEIWDILMSCWFVQSQKRPKFTHLVKQFSELLDRDATYLKLSQTSTVVCMQL